MKAVVPAGSEAVSAQIRLSPGVISGHLVFLTGMTGSGSDGAMPQDPAVQFRQAFDKIGTVLEEAGSQFSKIVEMTSYHIDIGRHFECFNTVRAAYVSDPFPAWTAVEVAGLRRPGALVEIRVIAEL